MKTVITSICRRARDDERVRRADVAFAALFPGNARPVQNRNRHFLIDAS